MLNASAMPRATVNVFRVDDRTTAESLLDSLKDQGLAGRISESDVEVSGTTVLFWTEGDGLVST